MFNLANCPEDDCDFDNQHNVDENGGYDDSMNGDFDSAMRDAGMGTMKIMTLAITTN
jgi:hypothetical protein